MPAITDLPTLLRQLQPVHNPGVYVFVREAARTAVDAADIVASIREPEGLSLIVAEPVAVRHGLQAQGRFAWITLHVASDLQAVGLTAAFATALADAGIGCNVVAGLHHDHIFVPLQQAAQAMDALQALQSGHAQPGPASAGA